MTTFKDLVADTSPGSMLFDIAHRLVFDKGDGNTEHLERLSPEARLVFVLWNFDGEIHNGGFDQFFSNSLGSQCEEILEHLEKVDAVNCHRMLRSAMAQYPRGDVPKDWFTRQELHETIIKSEEVQNAFYKLDEEFYRYEDKLHVRLEQYMRQNLDATVEA